jgi:regulator of protease activity HflC (stomatin/prohibitin superfamily)
MGTNHPYYLIEDGVVETRIDGNPFSQFFGGPGFVYAECDQAGCLTEGVRVSGVLEPGLNFTGFADLEPKAIELRPQLCSFPIEAVTRDGIPIRVLAYVAFRIHPGYQFDEQTQTSVRCEPQKGRSFPFRRRAIYQIVAAEPVQHVSQEGKGEARQQWDTELVPKIATWILQDIISRYDVDDLCALLDPQKTPYEDIIDGMDRRLRRSLATLGLDLEQTWLDNLWPRDQTVTERRLDNWRTEWERRILERMSDGRAQRVREIERARAQAELQILLRFSQIAQASVVTGPASQTALALRFIDSLGEVVSNADSQWPLPESSRETLRRLRGELEEGRR